MRLKTCSECPSRLARGSNRETCSTACAHRRRMRAQREKRFATIVERYLPAVRDAVAWRPWLAGFVAGVRGLLATQRRGAR
jgi:hypothetical protein